MRKVECQGLTGTTEYHAWEGMKARCYNTNHADYKNYGSRGITVCVRWRECPRCGVCAPLAQAFSGYCSPCYTHLRKHGKEEGTNDRDC